MSFIVRGKWCSSFSFRLLGSFEVDFIPSGCRNETVHLSLVTLLGKRVLYCVLFLSGSDPLLPFLDLLLLCLKSYLNLSTELDITEVLLTGLPFHDFISSLSQVDFPRLPYTARLLDKGSDD